MKLLELHKVAKFFGQRAIFKNVNLVVEAASISLLAGPNGAGKSTLLRLMAGLLAPSAGSCLCHVPAGRMAYLGHATFVYSGLSALENLTFWRDAQGLKQDEKALLGLLRRVGLERHALERAGIFSRGMAQRLNLARALMAEPELLLLDEPGTGLDIQAAAMLRQEIALAKERGAAVVWISHDLSVDAPLADRLLTLERGSLHVGASAAIAGEAAC